MTFQPNIGGGPAGLYQSEQEFYGRDLLFNGDRRVDAGGDYVTVDGIENLRQSLIRRILVRPGEYRLRPDYGAGLLSYVRKPFTTTIKAEITQRIKSQVARDRRIEKVVDVDVSVITFNNTPYFRVLVIAQVLGRRQSFRPFTLAREV